MGISSNAADRPSHANLHIDAAPPRDQPADAQEAVDVVRREDGQVVPVLGAEHEDHRGRVQGGRV